MRHNVKTGRPRDTLKTMDGGCVSIQPQDPSGGEMSRGWVAFSSKRDVKAWRAIGKSNAWDLHE